MIRAPSLSDVARARPPRGGFTLVELLVVLVLMGLALGLVAPALVPARAEPEAGLAPLLRSARETAVRRGEVVTVEIAPDGAWRMDGRASASDGALATGRLEWAPGAPLALVFSPLGTCSPAVAGAAAAPPIPLDPLACELAGP